MTKVRFHLANGPHYMKWQVKSPAGTTYYDPHEVSLEMVGCKLRNQRGTAERILAGENKTVCAWIECKGIYVHPHQDPVVGEIHPVRYNPRRFPHWYDIQLQDIDNHKFNRLRTWSRLIYKA